MTVLDVERQPGVEELAQPATGVVGGGGRGGTQMWRVCRRATQTYPPLLFQWSIKSKTHTHVQRTHTHTRSHTKPRHRLKSQSKLAPKGIPTTLFTKGIVYVFRVLSICCRNLRSLSLSLFPLLTHTHTSIHIHMYTNTQEVAPFSPLTYFPSGP